MATFVFLQIIQLSVAGKKKRTKVFFEISADDEPVGRIEMELFDDITPRWRIQVVAATSNAMLQDS